MTESEFLVKGHIREYKDIRELEISTRDWIHRILNKIRECEKYGIDYEHYIDINTDKSVESDHGMYILSTVGRLGFVSILHLHSFERLCLLRCEYGWLLNIFSPCRRKTDSLLHVFLSVDRRNS